MATPKGDLVPISTITLADVLIKHRDPDHSIDRQVFNDDNAGQPFQWPGNGNKVLHTDIPGWPLINRFPDYLYHNPSSTEIMIQEFYTFCPPYTVLYDL